MEAKKSQDAFEIERDKMAATCNGVLKAGVTVGIVSFLAAIVSAKFIGWPIYGCFLGIGICVNARLARHLIKTMAIRHGEAINGSIALSRINITVLLLLAGWSAIAVPFELLDDHLGVDPGHVHIVWVIASGAALASLCLLLVSLVRFWDPLSLNASR